MNKHKELLKEAIDQLVIRIKDDTTYRKYNKLEDETSPRLIAYALAILAYSMIEDN